MWTRRAGVLRTPLPRVYVCRIRLAEKPGLVVGRLLINGERRGLGLQVVVVVVVGRRETCCGVATG